MARVEPWNDPARRRRVVVIFFIPLTADLAPSPPNLGPVHAPASKLLTYGTVAASLLTHSLRAHHRVGLTHRGLFTRGEFASRWLSSQFTFTAPGEACVGIYLLYNLRHIERVRGTTRHVTHLLIASIVSLGLQTMLCNCDAPLARWLGLTGSASARSSSLKISNPSDSPPGRTPSSRRCSYQGSRSSCPRRTRSPRGWECDSGIRCSPTWQPHSCSRRTEPRP